MRAFGGGQETSFTKTGNTSNAQCSPSNSLIKVDTGLLIVLVRDRVELINIAANWQCWGLAQDLDYTRLRVGLMW